MLESLSEFRRRTAFVRDSLPREGSFVTNPRLAQKVSAEGKLRPFFGDTVIYEPDAREKATLSEIQRALYGGCGSMLAEPLDAASFHLTLHDLNSAPEPEPISAEMARCEVAVREILAGLPESLRRPLDVRATAAFSMVNTSVVLGFEPASEADCAALMELYERFQGVVRLNYPLTPHVTLAYYRPGDYGPEGLRLLRGALEEINRALPAFELRLAEPVYRCFDDMNHYLG